MKRDKKILIFGGTTEGRILGDILRDSDIPHEVSVATDYGEAVEKRSGEESILCGRKNAEEIAAILKSGDYLEVIDATHPYAREASREIKRACKETATEYIRLLRKSKEGRRSDNVVYAEDAKDAGEILDGYSGNILILTGSKELKQIVSEIKDPERIYVRVLPSIDSIKLCLEAGLFGKHVIAMQGPFSKEMNTALIREISASVILTKESGSFGGFVEKLEAAARCGIKTVVIKNPEEKEEASFEMSEVLEKISVITKTGIKSMPQSITLAATGCGGKMLWTREFSEALSESDIVFGASSVLEKLGSIKVKKIDIYDPSKVLLYIKENPEYRKVLIAYSGDISVCSGAKKAREVFEKEGIRIKEISGVSSVNLFAARLGEGLENIRIISCHGKNCNVEGYAQREEKLIILPSDTTEAARLSRNLSKEGRKIVAGFELGSDLEEIFDTGGREEYLESKKGKVLLYLENTDREGCRACRSLKDTELIRGDVPMTKEEIRALSVRKLSLKSRSVLYDIGAGTGSVSAEAALLHPGISVWSIERNPQAVELLKKNKEKLQLENMNIIEGEAPEALEGLPAPTHVFVGGSGRKLESIVRKIYDMNPEAVFTVNAITPQTLSDVTDMCGKLGKEPEIIQVFVTRYKKAGSYHLPEGMNPVYIISF